MSEIRQIQAVVNDLKIHITHDNNRIVGSKNRRLTPINQYFHQRMLSHNVYELQTYTTNPQAAVIERHRHEKRRDKVSERKPMKLLSSCAAPAPMLIKTFPIILSATVAKFRVMVGDERSWLRARTVRLMRNMEILL